MNTKTLPRGYRLAEVMDFVRNRKQMKIVAFSSLAIVVIMMIGGMLHSSIAAAFGFMMRRWYLWFALAAALIAYIPLHELTHGVFMHALSGVKPKYGLRLPYAYAGSDVYFDKRSHTIIALAPVVIWGAILQILISMLPGEWFWLIWALQISNVSGSAGDIYCVLHLARMPADTLIRDTGTRMTIYKKRIPATEEQKL